MEEKVLTVVGERFFLGNKIQIYQDINNPLYLAKDISEIVGYSKNKNGSNQSSKFSRMVSKENKCLFDIYLGGQIRKMIFLTETGVKQALSNSRLLLAKKLLEEIDNTYVIKSNPKQTEFEQLMVEAINYHLNSGVDFEVCPFNDKERYYKKYKDCLNYETEFKILDYKVDFFFPDFLLIVEYDENAHKYQEADDLKRQYEIEDYLNKENNNDFWEENGSIVTIIRVKEGKEFKGVIEIISHLMSIFI